MEIIVRKTAAEQRQSDRIDAKRNDAQMKQEIAKGKHRSKNAGFSEPGYNFGLGEYVSDRFDYKRKLKAKQREDPTFNEMG